MISCFFFEIEFLDIKLYISDQYIVTRFHLVHTFCYNDSQIDLDHIPITSININCRHQYSDDPRFQKVELYDRQMGAQYLDMNEIPLRMLFMFLSCLDFSQSLNEFIIDPLESINYACFIKHFTFCRFDFQNELQLTMCNRIELQCQYLDCDRLAKNQSSGNTIA